MTITLNGKPTVLPEGSTLADVVAGMGLPERGIALALDGEVVTRSAWPHTVVPAEGHIDVVTAMQGG